MEADATVKVLQKMSESIKEFEALFDLNFISAKQTEAVLHEAQELVTIANLSKLRQLEEKAQRDALTGVHNRVYFNEAFKQEFAVATRHGWPLLVAYIDIDHFKQVNDTYGHAVGDSALVTLSRLIGSQIRGGEEFVLLFPRTAEDAAWTVLSRIRETVDSFSHTFGAETYRITISMGLYGEGGFRFSGYMTRSFS